MKSSICSATMVVLMSFAITSCGDDPTLVEQREKQKAEITRLRGQIALIDEKLKNLPPDVSSELAVAKKLAETQKAEVSLLETEISDLEDRKEALESEFRSYRIKYQVK